MIKKLSSLTLKALTAFAIVGFVVVPPILHTGISLVGNQLLTKKVKVGAVYFNPFTLNLSLISLDIEDTANVASITVDLEWSDLGEFILPPSDHRLLSLNHILIDQPASELLLDKDGGNNFATLVSAQPNEAPVERQRAQSPVHILIKQFEVKDGQFDFTDQRYTHQESAFKLNFDNVNLTSQNAGWPEANTDLSISTTLNDQAEIKAQVHLQLAENPTDSVAFAAIELQRIHLPDFQPLINPYANAELNNGYLSVDVQANWHPESGLEVLGNVAIDELDLISTLSQETMIAWQHFQLNSLDYHQRENRLAIKQMALSYPEAVIAIDENLQVNLASLAKQPESPDQQPTHEQSLVSESVQEAFSLAIDSFSIDNGTMDFSDRSFEPGFATPIENLNGLISGFDTKSETPAIIKLAGRVDRYAPVNITGAITPSSPLDQTDLSMSFKNVELTTLTPYSGRFAGYSIKKGRLHLDLNYEIRNNQLSATNEMLLDKLILGSKVDSDESVDLPIRLAIALLKDRNGQIDIKLPVSGNLDNPEFKLGPVIRTALFNLITNLIAAPFDLLVSLVGGSAEDMQFIDFEPGQFSLQQYQQIESLDKLAKALLERPGLQLEVTGKTSTESDWPLVAEKLLNEKLSKYWIQDLESKQQPVPDVLSIAVLTPETRLSLLQQIAAQMNSAGQTSIDISSPDSAAITQQLLDQWPYNETAMRKLAIDRAREIKDYLMDEGGLNPERIYLLDVQHFASGSDDQTATELQLDAG